MGNQLRARVVSQIPQTVDMNKLFQIESSGNPGVINKRTQARGLGQITPIVLKEWNNHNPQDQHAPDDLLDGPTNTKISSWYANKRIPQMLAAYRIPDTVDNRLISYNAGIGTLVQRKSLPTETINYLNKYKELGQ